MGKGTSVEEPTGGMPGRAGRRVGVVDETGSHVLFVGGTGRRGEGRGGRAEDGSKGDRKGRKEFGSLEGRLEGRSHVKGTLEVAGGEVGEETGKDDWSAGVTMGLQRTYSGVTNGLLMGYYRLL